MMEIYNSVSFLTSKKITQAYSTSFSLGIKAFSPDYRNPIYGIYGFVRLADEIVDTFLDYDKTKLLAKLREDTKEAIGDGISTNPVLNAFQKVVKQYNIEWELIDAFLNSMEQDLTNSSYQKNEYDEYIYGSAEVVGLMCLKVFVKGNKNKYDQLTNSAKNLGSAFQKVNFLRDIKSDLHERGRIYLPDIHDQVMLDNHSKKNLELEIEEEFHLALAGIKKLPAGVKLGVYSAYLYYNILFKKIKKLNIEELIKKRVRVSNSYKFILFLKSLIEVRILKTT